MKKLAVILTGLLGAALMFTGCNKKIVENFEGNWKTESLTADGTVVPLVESEIALAAAENGTFAYSGNSGVNNYFGTLSIGNGKIKVNEDGGSTKMMGAPEEQDFEDKFLECLMNADSYNWSEKTLVIESKAKKLKITFVKE